MGDILEFKVTFEADGVTKNNMLLTRVDHNLYSVEETPVIVDCVSYKDIIEADLQPDGSLMFRRVVKESEMQKMLSVVACYLQESNALLLSLIVRYEYRHSFC